MLRGIKKLAFAPIKLENTGIWFHSQCNFSFQSSSNMIRMMHACISTKDTGYTWNYAIADTFVDECCMKKKIKHKKNSKKRNSYNSTWASFYSYMLMKAKMGHFVCLLCKSIGAAYVVCMYVMHMSKLLPATSILYINLNVNHNIMHEIKMFGRHWKCSLGEWMFLSGWHGLTYAW